jgi:sigma-B regulation protein RsbU (phosphoserine phosphatase)
MDLIIFSIFGEKLIILTALLAYSNILHRAKHIPAIKKFHIIITILLIRDVIILLLQLGSDFFSLSLLLSDYPIIHSLYVISETAVILIYLAWLKTYTGIKYFKIYIIIINLIFFIATVLYLILNPILLNLAFGWFIWVYISWLSFNIIYLGYHLYQVSEYNTENAEIIMENRKFFIGIYLFVVALVNLLVERLEFVSYAVVIPRSYFIHGYMLFQYHKHNITEKEDSITSLTSERENLFSFMQQIGSAISERIDLDNVFRLIVESAVQNTSADAGTILMIDDKSGLLIPRVTSGLFPPPYNVPDQVKVKTSTLLAYFKSTPIKIGENVLGETVEGGKPIFIRNTKDDKRMEHNTKFDTLFMSSFISVPLIVSKKILGVLAIAKRNRNQFFDESDYFHVRTFAEYASLTIDNLLTYIELIEKREIERELGIAAEIQKKLVPEAIPELRNATLSVYSLPAHGVSGDYYDIFSLDDNKIAMIVCDVAGKGVPAALVMVMIRSIVRLISSPNRDVATTVKWINLGITGRLDIDHYATLCFLTYDQNKQEIYYSNAAHHPLLLFRQKTNKFLQVDTEGLPIGIERQSKYVQKKIPVHSGDIIVLYTDGIIEAMNPKGEQYTLNNLQKIILKNADVDSSELTRRIKEDLDSFVDTRRQFDDQTLLILKIA